MYSYFNNINPNKTKEENLEYAKQISEEAASLRKQILELVAIADKKFPPTGIFNLTPAKKKQLSQPSEIVDRLMTVSRTVHKYESIYLEIERAEEKRKQEEELQATKKLAEEKKKELLNKAIVYCLENGRTFDDGLTIENALSVANEIAFEKEIQRREAEIGDNFIDFSGQNCEYECAGWTPESHRCQCGNRRVDWEVVYYSDFTDMTIYAQAY